MVAKMSRKLLSLFIVLLLIASPGLSTTIIRVNALNTTYYVSYSSGNDNNDGMSPATAWKTLTKASSVTMSQGDQILLKCGDTWTNDTLILNGSGTSTNPITISSYGTGNLPKISPDGVDYNCIYAYNVDGWKIMNLDLCNAKDGIHYDYNGSYNHNYLCIQNCNIHDLDNTYNSNPGLFNHFSSGISINGFSTLSNGEQVILSNITVQNINFNNVNVSWWVGTPFSDCTQSTGFTTGALTYLTNCNLSNMSVTNGGQVGYMFMCMRNSTITNCDTYNTGYNSFTYGSAGIVVGHSNNVVLDGCDVSYEHRNAAQDYDGMGVDFDGGFDNYNLTYKNATIQHTAGAGFTLFDGASGGLGTPNALIDNVSINYFGENPGNHSSGIHFGGTCSYGKVQNCTFNRSISANAYYDGDYESFSFTNNQYTTNVSTGKTATVSSYATNCDGSKAVDGNTSTYWCSNGYLLPSWLTVDLGALYQITNINQIFVNTSGWNFRIDVSSDNINWQTIVDNTVTAVNGNDFSYNVNSLGRYVRLYVTNSNNGAWATSEEFNVYCTAATNIAVGKTATVSNSQTGFEASKAVDGNNSTYWCTSSYILPSWLTVDLGSSYQITNINQLFVDNSNWKFRIDVSNDNSTWKTIVDNTVTAVNGSNFSYNVNTYGRYVRLYVTNSDNGAWATSREFSIFGIPLTNISQGKTATASNYQTGYEASKAVDGSLGTYWCTNGVVFPASLTVDLGSLYHITNIDQIFNNSCPWNFRIDISNDNSTWRTLIDNTVTAVSGSEFAYTVNDYGRYVRLYVTGSDGNWATSKEFSIYGTSATNLAVGKTAAASNYATGFEPSKAIDGNMSTYWCTSSYILPSYLTVDLGSSVQINNIDQTFVDSANWKFRIDISTDNVNWTTIIDNTITAVPGNEFVYNVNYTARYVRLYVTGSDNGAWATSKEFMVSKSN